MTDEAMSPLRRRMIEDMMIRKLAPKTQRDYVQRVKHFAAFLGRSPDTASFEDVRPISFTWRQVARAFRPSTQMVTALSQLKRFAALKRRLPKHIGPRGATYLSTFQGTIFAGYQITGDALALGSHP